MNRFENIIVIINDKNPNKELIVKSLDIAKANQAKLTFVGVVPLVSSGLASLPSFSKYEDLQQHLVSLCQESLKKSLSEFDGHYQFDIKILIGDHSIEVVKKVIRDQHDLLISSPFKKNIIDHIFTSKDMHLFRKCPCPILFVSEVGEANFKTIIAAVDFDRFKDTINDSLSDEVASLATRIALLNIAELHIVNVYNARFSNIASNWADQPEKLEMEMKEYEFGYAKQRMDQLIQRLKATVGEEMFNQVSVQTHLIFGKAEEQLPLFASKKHCDLLIMGTVARAGLSGVFIGNTAEDILSQIHCSVLAIKPQGFVSPISINPS